MGGEGLLNTCGDEWQDQLSRRKEKKTWTFETYHDF